MGSSPVAVTYSYHICEIYSNSLVVCLYIKFPCCLYSIENVWNTIQWHNLEYCFHSNVFYAIFKQEYGETDSLFCIQKTNASLLNIFICCFVFVFVLSFYVTGVEKWNLFFFEIMILEHLHFLLSIFCHVGVSHLLLSQRHLSECYHQNCLIETNVWTSSIRMIIFFTFQCEMFTSCNVSNNASRKSTQIEWTGVVKQIWTSLDRGGGVF